MQCCFGQVCIQTWLFPRDVWWRLIRSTINYNMSMGSDKTHVTLAGKRWLTSR